MEPVEEVMLASRDGVRLATDVYLPREAMGDRARRVPCLLVRVPYDCRGDVTFLPLLAEIVSARGMALVGQDMRGKFRSEGQRTPFLPEVTDGADTLDWLTRQAWSDGRVVVAGESYPGYAAWAAGASGHPALRGVVARVTSTRVRDDWLRRDEVFRLMLVASWARSTWSSPTMEEGEIDWSVRPLADLFADVDPVARSMLLDGLAASAGMPDGMAGLSVASVGVPVLHIGGWWDSFARGQLRDWRDSAGLGRGDRLVMAATDHISSSVRDPGVSLPDHAADPEILHAELPRLYADVLAFAEVVARDERPSGPPVRAQVAHGPWLELSSLPPQGERVRLALADPERAALGPEGGALLREPERTSGHVAWTHDPADLVPSLEPTFWDLLRHALDERAVEARDDVVTFTSDRVRREVDIVGELRFVGAVTLTARRGQLVATLVDVHPNGHSARIAEGVAALSGPLEEGIVRVELGSAAYRLRRDHRLRLSLASSSFPRYLWEPGSGEDPLRAVRGTTVDYRLRTGRWSAYLELDLLGDGAAVLAEALPYG